MKTTTLRILSVGLIFAIFLGLRTIFFTPGSTVTTNPTESTSFITQSHTSAPSGNYVPFDSHYGLQGRQRSAGKYEILED